MGILIGSAVVPVSLALLLETANGTACTAGEPPRYRWHLGCILLKLAAISLLAGAVVGLVMAFITWFSVAAANDPNGEVTIASTNSENPMLFGNLMALGCGGVIALGGSLAFPDTEFRWEMLSRIPMIDDGKIFD
eukprot:COSAG04_NODE_1179_length_7905_cov_12.347041_7_plen_135_part_00